MRFRTGGQSVADYRGARSVEARRRGSHEGRNQVRDVATIRLEIEGMRYAIIHAFETHAKDVTEALDTEMKKQIAEFDFALAVRRELSDAMNRAVTDSIRSFFSYGKGSQMVADAVAEAMNNWTPHV